MKVKIQFSYLIKYLNSYYFPCRGICESLGAALKYSINRFLLSITLILHPHPPIKKTPFWFPAKYVTNMTICGRTIREVIKRTTCRNNRQTDWCSEWVDGSRMPTTGSFVNQRITKAPQLKRNSTRLWFKQERIEIMCPGIIFNPPYKYPNGRYQNTFFLQVFHCLNS